MLLPITNTAGTYAENSKEGDCLCWSLGVFSNRIQRILVRGNIARDVFSVAIDDICNYLKVVSCMGFP